MLKKHLEYPQIQKALLVTLLAVNQYAWAVPVESVTPQAIQLAEPVNYLKLQLPAEHDQVVPTCGIVITLDESLGNSAVSRLASELDVREGALNVNGFRLTPVLDIEHRQLSYRVANSPESRAIFLTIFPTMARTLEDSVLISAGRSGENRAMITPLICNMVPSDPSL